MTESQAIEVRQVNPLDHADAIKTLFAEHDEPKFSTFFDRVYPSAVANGAASWVGFAGGTLVMHILRFPSRYRFAGQDVIGGMTANLLVAASHRTLKPALSLLRRVIEDSRTEGIDFLFTNPNEAALPVLRLARFRVVGTLTRHVMPVMESNVFVDTAIRVRQAWHRLRNPRPPGPIEEVAAAEFDATRPPAGPETTLFPNRGPDVFIRRINGYPGPGTVWYVARTSAEDEPAILLCTTEGDNRASVMALNPQAATALPGMGPTLASMWRRRGIHRVEFMTVAGSDLARAVQRAGFVPRPPDRPLTAIDLSPLGTSVLEHLGSWCVAGVDLDGPID